jgi:peptide/nickel transport system substrate-binding protein
MRIVPDENTRFAELMRGGLDLGGIRPAQADQARAAGGVRLLTHKPTTCASLAWNARRPMFGEARVRRALGMAVYREGLVQELLGGPAEPGCDAVRNRLLVQWFLEDQPVIQLLR